ncbi:MAG TPA: lipocalin-like domain-containing protein [Terriglobales bacterium]|nr:lipocalin-like domain-containing protein [Terriglobales bacterium]
MDRRRAIALLAVSTQALAQPGRANPLIGCWNLRSCVRTLRNGQTQYPFGPESVGRIEYDKAGRMFALLMRPGRRTTVHPGMELDQAPMDELRGIVTGFVSYFGSYDVDQEGRSVTHHVEASLVPSWVGTDLKRNFHFEGSRLVLTRVSPDSTSSDRLTLDREPD